MPVATETSNRSIEKAEDRHTGRTRRKAETGLKWCGEAAREQVKNSEAKQRQLGTNAHSSVSAIPIFKIINTKKSLPAKHPNSGRAEGWRQGRATERGRNET